MVSRAGREQVRQRPPWTGTAACHAGDHRSRRSDGAGESGVGLYANLGHEVGRGTIANIYKAHGIDPAPERDKHTRWSTFLNAHWECLAAADFLTVESFLEREGMEWMSFTCRRGRRI
jgi:hypothetical protein